MEKNIKSKLTDVPETMLIAIRARYKETKEKNGIIHDPKSVEILDQIDCDFTKKKEVSIMSQKGVAIRTEILDELTIDFMERHKDCVIVNLGCGLDTRYERLHRPGVRWYDLDVPESIELRKHFFEESYAFSFITKSALDFSWTDEVEKGKPTLFIAEGLLMYFKEEEVRALLKTIASRFKGSEIIFEAMSPLAARNSNKHADVKHYHAIFKWGIKSGREIEQWHIGATFLDEYYYDRHLDKMPWWLALLYHFAFRKVMKIIHLEF